MKVLKLIILFSLFILSSALVIGVSMDSIESYKDFNRKIPFLNEYLQDNPILLPSLALRIVQNDDVAIHVSTDEGYIESFVISIYQNYVTKIISGPQPTTLYIEIDEKIINEVIKNPDLALEYYKDGTIRVRSTSIVKKLKLFTIKTLAKWFT